MEDDKKASALKTVYDEVLLAFEEASDKAEDLASPKSSFLGEVTTWLENATASLISWGIDTRADAGSLAAVEGTALGNEVRFTMRGLQVHLENVFDERNAQLASEDPMAIMSGLIGMLQDFVRPIRMAQASISSEGPYRHLKQQVDNIYDDHIEREKNWQEANFIIPRALSETVPDITVEGIFQSLQSVPKQFSGTKFEDKILVNCKETLSNCLYYANLNKREALWEKAFASLKDEDKPPTDLQQLDKRTFLLDLTGVIEVKRQNCVDKEWNLNRGDGAISVRQIFGKMVSWINKFKEVGDVAIQYDPLHGALPWAAVRFVLEATVNEYDTNEALLEGLEYIASLIARYAMVEALYLDQASLAKDQLSVAIVCLYTAVLIYLGRASRFYSRNTPKRVMKAAFQPVKLSVDAYFQKIRAEEANVNNLTQIFNAGLLRQVSATMENDQEFQDLLVTLSCQLPTRQVSPEQLLTWIDAIFTKDEYERALETRLDGTCDWILKQSDFLTWISSIGTEDTTKILWIYGPAGFGKSVLCARLIDHLQNDLHKSVAYFFCSFFDESKRQPQSILRSWVAQLILQQNGALAVAKTAYLERQSSKATEQDLWLLLKRFHAQVENCVFVVDGYDECVADEMGLKTHASSKSPAAFLKVLMSSIKDSKSRLLLVSRDDHNIREQLADAELSPRSYEIFRLRVTPDHTREDVISFSTSVLKQRLPRESEDLQLELGLKAAEICEGMFLWVRLLRDELSTAKNVRQLQKMVFDTPIGLTQAYERDLKAIREYDEEDKDRAVMLLWWTLHAVRPLTVQEVTEALLIAMNNEDTSYPIDELPDDYDDYYVDSLRRLCGSLIDIRGPDQSSNLAKHEVQFVHFSVKEYLSESLENHFAVPHGMSLVNRIGINELLAQKCLRYLCYDDFKQDSPSTKESFDERMEKHAFIRYAATQWDVHASRAMPLSPDTISLSNRLHDPLGSRWRLYFDVWLNEPFGAFATTLTEFRDYWSAPLYLASNSGIIETVGYLLDQGVDINALAGGYPTALQKAASRGHVNVLELLLRRGADAVIKAGHCGSALNAAAAPEAGPADAAEKMVPMLLSEGVEIESRDERGWTPLHFASTAGSTKVVQLLLDAGAEIDAATIDKQTALHIACSHDDEQIVSLLLSRGAHPALCSEMIRGLDDDDDDDDDERFVDNFAALHIAIKRENVPMMTILLDHGADLNARTAQGWSPLHHAAQTGNERLVKTMLERGAIIYDTTTTGATPLHIAMSFGHEKAVGVLLNNGVNFNAQNSRGLTALHMAASCGHVKVVSSLLYYGAYLETRGGEGWTALSMAAHNGHVEVVDLLLDRGADPNTECDTGESSLIIATRSGHVNIINLLLNHNVDPNVQDDDGWTALLWATKEGYVEVVRLFLNRGADPNIQNKEGCTALFWAAIEGYVEIIVVLLDNGADPNIQEDDGLTALDIAKYHNLEQVVEVLLKRGAWHGGGSEGGASDEYIGNDGTELVLTSHNNAEDSSTSRDGEDASGSSA